MKNKDYLNTLAQTKKILMKVSRNKNNSEKTRKLAKEALHVTRKSISDEINSK